MPSPLRIPSKPGYDPDFLGIPVPLPEFGPELIDEIVAKPELRDDVYADYVNYTVAMSARHRAPIFAALNIDQSKFRTVSRSNDWRIDTRIGAAHQLNNDYYRSNPWDRGHIARRATAAWGDGTRQAKHASDDTFFYSNAALQHKNFNRDEWLALEDWVKDFTGDDTNRLTSVSGPVWGEHPRAITPQGRETALIPTAFFKVVTYVKDGALEVRAYLMSQDAAALRDMRGKRMFDNQRYQVSVTEIEELTGLIFPQEIPDANPLFFNMSGAAEAVNLREDRLPERIEVDDPAEVVAMDQPRAELVDDEVAVFIAAAMVNPKGPERAGEWVTIINLSEDDVSLKDWAIADRRGARLTLGDMTLAPGEAARVTPLAPVMLGNEGGIITLWDAAGRRIDRVKYRKEHARTEGRPIVFTERSEPIAASPLVVDD